MTTPPPLPLDRPSGAETPEGTLAGMKQFLRHDLLSGFLVFLIALPLCLGISLACGYPAIAGIFTAIIGGIVGATMSNSELTIKGPAAGLIVIAIGCVTEFGFTGGANPDADYQAYRLALGVGVAAGLVQIFFGVFRAGILAELVPTSVIHGMLAAIGIIIIAKQFPIMMGLSAKGEPLELLMEIPTFVMEMNPEIGLIGLISLAILAGYPYIKSGALKKFPAPLIVLMIAIPLEFYFDLDHPHAYTFNHHEYQVGPNYLVNVPLSMLSAMAFPDFSGVFTGTGMKYVVLFALIGSLESLLSAKAVEVFDPWKRKANLDRDLTAVGIGNTVAALIGGLPMISEIVRSKANVDNGARTRFANFYHGMFLLLFVALLPGLLNEIPLAALAAMLVITGFRLAAPAEFVHVYHVGKEQLLIFLSTVVGVLTIDLLAGIAIGITVNILVHLVNGASPASLFRLHHEERPAPDGSVRLSVKHAAIFPTWITLRRKLHEHFQTHSRVELDLSETCLVDHTVMSRLQEMQADLAEKNRELMISGLDGHQPLSHHKAAARKKSWSKSASPDKSTSVR
ncbi:MAG: SulP family inorganic anion transporter [Nitrospira sp.]|nr:SulP family inorganic anion transporter [Nitrospira sp.]